MTGNLLEAVRDRLIIRSQIMKRKLDRSATRRELDDALRNLGERYRTLAKTGRVELPAELERAMQQVVSLEERLAEQDGEIAGLEREHPGRAT